MTKLSGVFARAMPVFLVIFSIYLICLMCGVGLAWVQGDVTGTTDQADVAKQRSIERVFGKFREPLRRGNVGTFAVVTLIVFMVNVLGNMVTFTLPGIFGSTALSRTNKLHRSGISNSSYACYGIRGSGRI